MAQISRFTPWLTPRAQLERISVGREGMVGDLIGRIQHAADTPSRQHTLLIGPRGVGKTHLLALTYYQAQDELSRGARFQVARLPEDPWTILSYARLLAAILDDLGDDTSGMAAELEFRLERRYEQGGVIAVLLENLDEIFAQIGTGGQRQLRHFLQTSPALLLLATTPSLDRSLTEQDSPFYGYFSTLTLAPLTLDEAGTLVRHLAELRDDNEGLLKLLEQESADRRLEAIAHLAGSQPRLWVTFGKTLTSGGIQNLADHLLENFDDLTPYYQDRLRGLSSQQRLVVAELAATNRALPVHELGARLGIPQTSVARTVKELKDLAWVTKVITPWDAYLDKRRSYYELSEPLAGLAFKVKESHGEPLRLIVDFLSFWFDPDDVSRWREGNDLELYEIELAGTFSKSAAVRVTRRLSRLPDCAASDVELLGQVDDTLAAIGHDNAEPLMALPTGVRYALELRWQELAQKSPDATATALATPLRLEIHKDALSEMGDVPREPQSSEWIARAENLVTASGHDQEAMLIWMRWLAHGWRLEEAQAVLDLIGPETALASLGRHHLAAAYSAAGRSHELIPLLEEGLAVDERVLGSDDPDTLRTRNNLATAYWETGRIDEAVRLQKLTLVDSEHTLGPDHPDTLRFSNNLALDYLEAGLIGKALSLNTEILANFERILGPDHPDTLTSRNNLAGVYWEAGQIDEAIHLGKQTLTDYERILGPDHPKTLTSRNNLAMYYWKAGQVDEAISLGEQTLATCERILGRDHPDTLTSRNNLALIYEASGRGMEAARLNGASTNNHVPTEPTSSA